MHRFPSKRHNWVCTDCRRSVRRTPFDERDVLCPECGQLCEDIGSKRPVPRRADADSWKALATDLDARRPKAISQLEWSVDQRRNAQPGRTSTQRWSAAIARQDEHLRRLKQIEGRRSGSSAQKLPLPTAKRRGSDRPGGRQVTQASMSRMDENIRRSLLPPAPPSQVFTSGRLSRRRGRLSRL